MATVYLAYDAGGGLLYVGMTCSGGLSRMKQHEHASPWWADAARFDLEHFATKEEAAAREFQLIRNSNPSMNRPVQRVHDEKWAVVDALRAEGKHWGEVAAVVGGHPSGLASIDRARRKTRERQAALGWLEPDRNSSTS